MRSAGLALMALACVAVVVPGCARRPGSTPQSAYAALQEAHAAGDFGAVFDLMAASAQKEFADALAAKAEELKNAPPFAKQLIGFDPAEAAALPPREAFVKVMGGLSASRKLSDAMTGTAAPSGRDVPGAVAGCSVEGDTATLTVEDGGTRTKMELVREGGLWKFSSPVARHRIR